MTEAEQPISVLAFEFVPDKAGAGKWRGGVPYMRDYRLNTEEATLQVRSDRKTFRPFGLYGGSPGVASENYLDPGTARQQPLNSKLTRTFHKGEVFRHVHPGGGGCGDPLERDPALVLKRCSQRAPVAGQGRR